jgi:gentisate 1,2-dioxygenase
LPDIADGALMRGESTGASHVRRREKKPFTSTPALDAYHERIATHHLAPLWQRLGRLLTPEPRVDSLPQRWHYDGLRDLLLESATLISAEEAERRVLILENAGLPGSSAIVESLFAGLQLVMPGEVAPSHRHSPAALRFILEGSGAYTAVDGEKLPMHPGDFIVTPSWAWHDHGHHGTGPFVWLDVLDLPTVRNTGAIFFEEYPDQRYPETRPPEDSLYRYGTNMVPLVPRGGPRRSPLLSYPYERTRDSLEHLRRHSDWDACHGLKMEFVDPTTGGAAIPTISTFIQLLPAGFATEPYRSTDGTVFCVVEGTGKIIAGSGTTTTELAYAPRDIVAMPCWQRFRIAVDEETVLFSASDRVIQQQLGLWREQRGG